MRPELTLRRNRSVLSNRSLDLAHARQALWITLGERFGLADASWKNRRPRTGFPYDGLVLSRGIAIG